MIEQKEVTIKGDKYLITQFGGIKGVKLGKRVGRVLLPIIGTIYTEDGEVSLPKVLETVAENLDYLDEQLIMELMSSVTKNGVALDFDKEFAGNYDTLFKLLQAVVEFNFQSLFHLGLDDSEE